MNYIFYSFLFLIPGFHFLEVSHDEVPFLVLNSAEDDSVVLDCKFDFTSEDERPQVDIQWYFNNEPSPIYMWIPSSGRKPQILASNFRDHIDLEYKTDEDSYKSHSSLRLINLSSKLSGAYRCKVATFQDEKLQERMLMVYTLPEEVNFSHYQNDDYPDSKVICAIKNVYPEPSVFLTWTYNNSEELQQRTVQVSGHLENDGPTIHYDEESGLYDISLSHTVDETKLFSADGIEAFQEESVILSCELEISDAKFSQSVHLIYNKSRIEDVEETGLLCSDEDCLSEQGSLDFEEFSGDGSGDFSGSGSGSGYIKEVILEEEIQGEPDYGSQSSSVSRVQTCFWMTIPIFYFRIFITSLL